jgi:4-hydroxybenzoate polyprenyltransferase
VIDRKKDSQHPTKKKRPIASGKIKPIEAILFAFVLSTVSVFVAFKLSINFGFAALFYILLFIFYSLVLKKIVILDILIIALGFVTRAVAGGLLINVEISDWLLIVTIFLAIFLGFSKRRGELINLNEKASQTRPILNEYSIPLLDQLITISAASTLMSYALYTLAEQTIRKFGDNLWMTFPVVVYIVFRYFYLVYQKGAGGDPAKILIKDIPLLVGVIFWALLVFVLVYWKLLF